jgi:zinc transporter, ZIP family
VSTAQILALGAVAGLTIFIGLPMGRVHDVAQGFKAFLSATATGILLFLFWDVLKEAVDPVESALNASHWGRFSWLSALAFGGFALGLLSLVYYDAWMKARRRKSFLGPGAASATELERSHFTGLTPARWLSLFIASGIGLHNFSEGLAIGQAAALDKLSLAYVLVIGFGLHNATEGFGIVGPLGGIRPSWRWLGLAGLVAGGPTFVGAMVGYQVTSDALELCFFALAGGAILYVIGEIWAGVRRQGHAELGLYMLGVGFLLGIATDLVVAYGGA